MHLGAGTMVPMGKGLSLQAILRTHIPCKQSSEPMFEKKSWVVAAHAFQGDAGGSL